MKRGALNTEVIMFINDLRERCGSGRSGSSCHVNGIIDENHKKVGKGFAENSAKLARAPYAESRVPREHGVEYASEAARCARIP
jgi:hypothetical protein